MTQKHTLGSVYWEHYCKKKCSGHGPLVSNTLQNPVQKVDAGFHFATTYLKILLWTKWQGPSAEEPACWCMGTALLYKKGYLERYPRVRDGIKALPELVNMQFSNKAARIKTKY